MRKWTYLVAALLMSGATATFTSCIDTEEPAGITDLRGAKADFIRAKAAYQDAVTQLELVKVQREEIYRQMEEIDLQMKQIDLELKQAHADYLIEEWTQKRDLLVEQYAALMANAQAATARAQAALVEALAELEIAELTGRDSAFAAEILEVRGLLNSLLYSLPTVQDDLYQAQMAKLQYESRNKNYVYSRELAIAEKEYDLNIYKQLLESYEAISDPNDMADLNAQKAEIQNQINALDQEEATAVMAIQEARISGVLAEASREAEGVMNELSKDSAFVLPVAQVDASIQENLYYFLNSNFPSSELDNSFADGVMTADYKVFEPELQYLKGNVDNFAYTLLNQDYYNSNTGMSYNSAKDAFMNDYIFFMDNPNINESLFDNDNQVKESYLAQIQAKRDRLAIDAAVIKSQYESDLKAWVDGYINYQGALKAYGYAGENYNAANEKYEAAEAAIEAFKSAYEATTATDATKKSAATTLRTAIQNYAAARNVVDGAAEFALENFNNQFGVDNTTTPATDPLDTPANVDNLYLYVSNSSSYILGQKDIIQSMYPYEATDYSDKGTSTLHKYIKAALTLFGNATQANYNVNVKDVYVPVLEDPAVAPTDYSTAVPANFDDPNTIRSLNIQGSYKNNRDAQHFEETYPGIVNYDKWLALYNYVNDQADLIGSRVLALNNQKNAIIEKYEDAYMQVWEAELQAYLIKGNTSVYINGQSYSVISRDNPYYNYIISVSGDMSEGGVGYSELTKLSALQRQQQLIEDAIASGTLVYVTYDEYTNQYTTTNGTTALQTLIEDTKEDIALIEQSIAEYEDQIAWFNEYGWDNDKTAAYYDNQIASKQQIVDNMEANIQLYTEQLQKLLDAIAAE